MSRLQWRIFSSIILSLCFCQSVFASVVMTGSRIIYPSDAKSVDLQLRNDDDFPYVIQTWFDSGDPSATPETGVAPFIVTPPTFRIAAKEGQILRVFFTKEQSLPQDRESVFYFNFLQIPPANIGGDNGSKIVLMLKNRMKVFYRPKGLKANNKNIFDYLTVSNASVNNIRVTNTSPYYISLSKVNVNGVNAKDKTPMIAPFAAADIALNAGKVTDKINGKGIEISLVNDYGGTVTHVYPFPK